MCQQLTDTEIELELRRTKGVKQQRLLGALASYAVGVDDMVDTMGTGGYRRSTQQSRDNLLGRLIADGFVIVCAPNVIGNERMYLATPCPQWTPHTPGATQIGTCITGRPA